MDSSMNKNTIRNDEEGNAIDPVKMRVKIMAIILGENPADIPVNADNKQDVTENLIRHLRDGFYPHYKIEGTTNGLEPSIMIFNISLDDISWFAAQYSLEKVIYVDMTNPPHVSYQYLERIGPKGPLETKYEDNKILDAKDVNDYYTRMCNSFQFKIPFDFESVFGEHINDLNERLNKKEEIYGTQRIERLINESLDNKFTGKHQYFSRGYLYGK